MNEIVRKIVTFNSFNQLVVFDMDRVRYNHHIIKDIILWAPTSSPCPGTSIKIV